MYKIIVFGYGGIWSVLKKKIDFSKCEIIAFINSDIEENGKVHDNVKIIHTKDIKNYKYDFLILASQSTDKLLDLLKQEDISLENVIIPYIYQSQFLEEIYIKNKNELLDFSKLHFFNKFSNVEIELPSLISMDFMGRARKTDIKDSKADYVRLSTLELIADEIKNKKITGNIAELGVYRGEFAKHINRLFYDRKMYLFDTFEGFSSKDINFDKKNNYSNPTPYFFDDTSVNLVMEKMPYPENIIVKKGYFPLSLEELEDRFAFVSIDTDLYKPIYSGLEYFYPRLVKGGYIMIHDYNNDIYSGVKEAVNKFAIENEITVIPLSDRMGSAIIIKQ